MSLEELIKSQRSDGSYQRAADMSADDRYLHRRSLNAHLLGTHYRKLHRQDRHTMEMGRGVSDVHEYAGASTAEHFADHLSEKLRPSTRHKGVHYGESVSGELEHRLDHYINPRLVHGHHVAFHHGPMDESIMAAAVPSHVTTGGKGRVIVNSKHVPGHNLPPMGQPAKTGKGTKLGFRDILNHEIVHATLRGKNPQRWSTSKGQLADHRAIGEEARADKLGVPGKGIYQHLGFPHSDRELHQQAGSSGEPHMDALNHTYNRVRRAIPRNAAHGLRAIAKNGAPMTTPKPRSVRRKTALGAGIGTYVGGSKAFGTRAAAGEALDWSQHFAAKFPKAGPALGKVDRVATAAHNLPRGPLLTTGLVGGAALGGAVEHHRATKVAKGSAEEIIKATRRPKVKEKVSRTKTALAHMSITPEQARHATVLGQVGSSAGTVAGSAAGALMGIKGKKVATGMGVGAGVGAAFGGGVGASLGLYSGKHHHDGVLKRAPGQTDSQKWERRTANGLNVVGGAADAFALKTGYQATKGAFKTGKSMDKLALPAAVTGIAAAGVNAHLINHKKKETTVAKNDYDVEEVFKFSREAKKGAKIGAAIEGVSGGVGTRSVGGAVGGAALGAVEGAAIGGLVHGHRRRVAARAAKAPQASVVKRDYDVDEIFKLSRDAKTGAGIGAGYTGYRVARKAKPLMEGMKAAGLPSGKAKLAVGIGAAGGAAVNTAIGAGVGGIVHGMRKPKAPKVPGAPQA